MSERFEQQPNLAPGGDNENQEQGLENNPGAKGELHLNPELPETNEVKEMTPEQKYEMTLGFVVDNVWQVMDRHKEIAHLKKDLADSKRWQGPPHIPDRANRDKWIPPASKDVLRSINDQIKKAKQELDGWRAVGQDIFQSFIDQGEALNKFKGEDVKRFIKKAARQESSIQSKSGFWKMPSYNLDNLRHTPAYGEAAMRNNLHESAERDFENSKRYLAKMIRQARNLKIPHTLCFERAVYESDSKHHPGLYQVMREWI